MYREHYFYYTTHHAFEPNLIVTFLNYEPLSQLMQGAGMAVLTLLISFAIGIFVHVLDNDKKEGGYLDLHVALDYVWRFKLSVALLLVVVISPFFIGVGSNVLKGFIFVTWAVALAGLLILIFRLYAWVKGNKSESRVEYLSDFPKPSRDTIVSWLDLWKMDIKTEEKDFFVPFSNKVDSLIDAKGKEDWETLSKLIKGYVDNLDKRDRTFLVVFPEFFPKVLEWHFKLWKIQYSQYAKDKVDGVINPPDVEVFEIDHMVDSIVRSVTKIALEGHSTYAFSYFKALEIHTDKYGNEFITGKEHIYKYPNKLPIYADCLNLIPASSNSYEIWGHFFPSSWKITQQHLEHNVMAQIWYDRYLDWARDKIWNNSSNKWDQSLEEVSRELFPNVEPMTWAEILTFVMRPYGESRMKTIVEKGTIFGMAGRIIGGSGDNLEVKLNSIYEEQLGNTFDFATYLFRRVFTKPNIELWLAELENLQYSEESTEFARKQEWKRILNALEDRI